MAFEMTVIDPTEIEKSRRGRPAPKLDKDLVAGLKKVSPGKTVVLKGYGNVEKDKRSATSATIRRHWEAAFGPDSKCDIAYAPSTGFPQVTGKVAEKA